MVLRRGQSFKFIANLNRPINFDSDQIGLLLRYGSRPNATNGTEILVGSESSWGWSLKIESAEESSVTCSVTSPSDAMIGRYSCAVYFETDGLRKVDQEPDLVLIFNPWCETDEVYMENADERDEYIMNDTGYIWRGTSNYSSPCAWNFGQSCKNVLKQNYKPSSIFFLIISRIIRFST